MTRPETLATMLPVFREVFDDDALSITAATTAKDVDGWDSLTHIRLMLAIETAFRVRIKSTEAAKLENVGALAELIERKLG